MMPEVGDEVEHESIDGVRVGTVVWVSPAGNLFAYQHGPNQDRVLVSKNAELYRVTKKNEKKSR